MGALSWGPERRSVASPSLEVAAVTTQCHSGEHPPFDLLSAACQSALPLSLSSSLSLSLSPTSLSLLLSVPLPPPVSLPLSLSFIPLSFFSFPLFLLLSLLPS